MTDFHTIGLITKPVDGGLRDTVRSLLDYLQSRALEVLPDRSAAVLLKEAALPTHSHERIAARCDLAIVVGGDGTLLHAAHTLASSGVPIVGVNRGRLGFLVDITPDEMTDRLDEILAGAYHEESRALLHARILRGDEVIAASDACNDVVVHAREVVRMIELDTHIDGRYLNTQRADGLIVATPTGSTAYALSGGGPILHPSLDAMVLVPICPHTLSNRPIVIGSTSRVEIVLRRQNPFPAQVSFDGQTNIELAPEDRIVVDRQDYVLRLLQPRDYDFFHILRAKLRWSEQP